ncbi:MAG: M48 family metalloprotease [Sphingomonadaceae bacterium]|nr:M48 family metalloprotease [Sphingomonadaceae bacterium]
MKRSLPLAALALLAAAPPPVPGPGYAPRDADERGLWMQVDEEERALKTSNFLIRDPGFNAYVRKVFCRTVGEVCRDVRIYIVRTPYFNASMAPNGMMLVWSGLFLRTRDEAQLAAVLGHEFTHYRERHSLQGFRDIKKKTNAMAWLSMIPVGGYAAAGAMTTLQVGMIGSIFSFSREMESAADAGSVGLLAKAGYDPRAASRIWAQIRAEDLATAAQRGRKARREGGMFATHPTSAARQAALDRQAAALSGPSDRALNAAEYRAALAPFWADFIDDQIKLNDFGATELLLEQLAGANGWTGDLLYARGELYRARGGPGDFILASGYYCQAIAAGGAPVEAWRGLGLALLRAGDKPGGQAALASYLARSPAAKDRPMVAMLAGVTP